MKDSVSTKVFAFAVGGLLCGGWLGIFEKPIGMLDDKLDDWQRNRELRRLARNADPAVRAMAAQALAGKQKQ
jgi:hypothetical protein